MPNGNPSVETPAPSSRPKRKRPGVNRPAVRAAIERFLLSRGGKDGLPTPEEVADYLDQQVADHGLRSAQADFAHLQIAAAQIWGAEATSFFARVLREHRVTEKRPATSAWQKAAAAIARLPGDWQQQLLEIAARSEAAKVGTRGAVYSAARLRAVAEALVRWAVFCEQCGIDPRPTGASLTAYADGLLGSGSVGRNSVADYLERIVTGYHDLVAGTPPSPGAVYVCRRFKEPKGPALSKSADQLVGASTIYALGRQIFDQARQRATRSTSTAIMARNGILLMLAAAIGQRARAMSVLEFDRTLILGPRPRIVVDLPGAALKVPQRQRATARRREEFVNGDLWDALSEYRSAFRPIFDGGDGLFPSKQAIGRRLSESALSNVVGAQTEKHLKARVTLHRVRDNVATESVEDLACGLQVAAGVLGHKDSRTTAKHYDRAQGRAAMARLADFTARRRGKRTRLVT